GVQERAEAVVIARDRRVEGVEVLGIDGQRSVLQRLRGDVGRPDVLVDVDAVALGAQRLGVELPEHELLGEVLVADGDHRLAGAGQGGGGGRGRGVGGAARRRRGGGGGRGGGC